MKYLDFDRFDSRTLVIGQFILLIGLLLTPPHKIVLFVLFAIVLSTQIILSGVQLNKVVAEWKRVLPFVLIILIPALLFRLLIPGGEEGGLLIDTLGLFVRVLLMLSTVLFLTTIMTFNELLNTMRRLRVPWLLIDVTALAWRYLDVLNAERISLVRAIAARGRTPRWIWQSKSAGRLAGSLFLRSIERAERIHRAMVARGDGKISSQAAYTLQELGWMDAAYLASILVITVILVWIGV